MYNPSYIKPHMSTYVCVCRFPEGQYRWGLDNFYFSLYFHVPFGLKTTTTLTIYFLLGWGKFCCTHSDNNTIK